MWWLRWTQFLFDTGALPPEIAPEFGHRLPSEMNGVFV